MYIYEKKSEKSYFTDHWHLVRPLELQNKKMHRGYDHEKEIAWYYMQSIAVSYLVKKLESHLKLFSFYQ